MTAIALRVISLSGAAVRGAERDNSLCPPDKSSFPRNPFPQTLRACFAGSPKFFIPFALSRDVAAPQPPSIEQMPRSCLTQWLAAIGIRYRDFEFLASIRGLI